MSSYKLFTLFALTLLTFAYANTMKGISLDFWTDYDLADFNCFTGQGKQMMRIPIFTYKNWKISSSFATHYNNAVTAGFKSIDVLAEIMNNGNTNRETPSYICSSISETLPATFNGTVWLGISDPAWNGIIEDRLDFLEAVINYCNALGLSIGIHTDTDTWTETFASSFRSSIPKKLSFARAFGVSDASFEDFEPFGSWDITSLKIKEYQTDAKFCGRTVSFLFHNDTAVQEGRYLSFNDVNVTYSTVRPKDETQNYDPLVDLLVIMNPNLTVNGSGWNSGAYAEQWIEFALKTPAYIDQLALLPSIYSPVSDGKSSAKVQIDITCEDGSVFSNKIEKVFDRTAFENVTIGAKIVKVRITTLEIDSWVGWTRVLFKLS